jgi:hypothetical protein
VDRLGQALPMMPVVNLYLKNIDQQAYRALNARGTI